MNLFKRKPKEETVSKAEHDRIVAKLRADVRAAEMAYDASRDSHRRVARELAELRAADERRKAQARANLKQNRPRDKQQAEVGA